MQLFAGLACVGPRLRYAKTMDETTKSPIIWAGGKQRMIKHLQAALPDDYREREHVELFAGGASLLFAQAPSRAMLCDVNARLIGTYSLLRESVESVIYELKLLAVDTSAEAFYRERALMNASRGIYTPRDAARFLYLNRACVSGLYRENARGDFNVSFGHYKSPRIVFEERLRAASRVLQRTRFTFRSFEACGRDIDDRSFVYLDPPYDASWTGYSASSGRWDAQMHARMRDYAEELVASRDCAVLISQSDTPLIRELYSDAKRWRVREVTQRRSVNAKAQAQAREVLISSY